MRPDEEIILARLKSLGHSGGICTSQSILRQAWARLGYGKGWRPARERQLCAAAILPFRTCAHGNLIRTLEKLCAAGLVHMRTTGGRRKAPTADIGRISIEIDPYRQADKLELERV